MRTVLALFFTIILSTFAFANTVTVDTSKMTPEQIRILTTTNQPTEDVLSPERINEYAEIGKNVGEGLASAAKELGVAVNDFASTNVGQVALFLIVWRIALADIVAGAVGVLFGIGWLIAVVKGWSYYFNKLCIVSSETETIDENGKKHRTVQYYNLADPKVRESQAGYRFVTFVALVVLTIPAWIMIF